MEIIRPNTYTTILKFKNSDIKEIGVLISSNKWGESFESYWGKINQPSAIINGGFFGTSLSTVVSAGYQPVDNQRRNFGLAIPSSRNIYEFRKFVDGGEYDYVGAVPFLVFNGRIQTYTVDPAFETPHPRSFIGCDNDHFYMGTIDGRQTGKPGSTLQNLAKLMMSLGWTFGMNLDGGGSTKVVGADQNNKMQVLNSPSENRAVGNVVYICEKRNTLPTIRQGSESDTVGLVRNKLVELGYTNENYFGTELDRLVRKFQQDKGLVVDGVCGPATYRSLGLM